MKFDWEKHKSVIIVDENLPLGLAMNAVSVIGVSFGRIIEDIVGHDVSSLDDIIYPGVVKSPLPILKASQLSLNEMQHSLTQAEGMILMPVSSLAQSCKTYKEYEEKLSKSNSQDLPLSGLGVFGSKKQVNKSTGSLPLYK